MPQQKVKQLFEVLQKHSGRDNQGHVSVRHQGGRQKRFYRMIDWLRDKDGVTAKVVSIEYDPNRSCDVALVHYADGDKRYILAPEGLTVGQQIMTGDKAEIRAGNTLYLKTIPVGTLVHNIELRPGHGAQIVRSAGSFGTVLAKEGPVIHIKLPSGEIRLFNDGCRATVGQLGNADWKNRVIGKAGTSRRMGRRPTVRGVAQNPRSHPHGGGEGRSGIGLKSPKSPWGKRTLGKKTRKLKKYSDKYIVSRRK